MSRGCFSDVEGSDAEGWHPGGGGGARGTGPEPLSREAAGAFSDSDGAGNGEFGPSIGRATHAPASDLALGSALVSGGAPAPALGEASNGELRAESLHWEKQVDLGHLRALGPQVRPLRTATVFSGINSPLQALRKMGVDVVEVASAEKKEHAWRVCQRNGLVGGCWFSDAVPLSSGEGSCCRVHGENHQLDAPSLDLLVAGFPC